MYEFQSHRSQTLWLQWRCRAQNQRRKGATRDFRGTQLHNWVRNGYMDLGWHPMFKTG